MNVEKSLWRRFFALFATFLMLGSAVAAGVAVSVALTAPKGASGTTTLPQAPLATSEFNPEALMPDWSLSDFCTAQFGTWTTGVYGPVCGYTWSADAGILAATLQGANAGAKDIQIITNNYFNQTAVMASTYNATIQQLLTYYSDRAESIVPAFLSQNWTNVTGDEILSYSGFGSAAAGFETALGEQEYQDWNASLWSFYNEFGKGNAYAMAGTSNFDSAALGVPPYEAGSVLYPGSWYPDFVVSQPWEFWTGYSDVGTGGTQVYFTLQPGGTVVSLNDGGNVTLAEATGLGSAPSEWVVNDLTTGGGPFAVPQVNDAVFVNGTSANLPTPISTTDQFGQFDLLKATCLVNCSSALLAFSDAYVYNESSNRPYQEGYLNVLVPHIVVGYPGDPRNSLFKTPIDAIFPQPQLGMCVEFDTNGTTNYCDGSVSPSEGYAAQVAASGPGQVVGGAEAFQGLPSTFYTLAQNVVTMAHVYFTVLKAITDGGKYAIPVTCSIPPPSDAFPASLNTQLYGFSEAEVFAIYLSYLDSVAQSFGGTVTEGMAFCGMANLAFTFSWSSNWYLNTNITASYYFTNAAGNATYINGTLDPTAVYGDELTWPVQDISPSILMPTEFEMNVPVNVVYPIPVNDPLVGALVDYSGNPLFNESAANITHNWGIPTYLQLYGFGNFINVNGTSSPNGTTTSPSHGDAIYIGSCIQGNVTELHTCDLSVTYFNSFVYGIIHALVAIPCIGVQCTGLGHGQGPGNVLGNDCGFGNLDQWYDGWAGYIGAGVATAFSYIGNLGKSVPVLGSGWSDFWGALGCILGWIVIIIVILLLIWIVFKVCVGIYRSRRD